MRSSFLLIFICFLCATYAQNQYRYEVGISAGINRMDVFTGLQGAVVQDKWNYLFQFELGINRTFFQQRIFPRMSGGFGYAFVSKEWLQMVAQVNYTYSFLKIYALSKHKNHWNELYGGIKFVLGKNVKFFTLVSSGWMNELYYNEVKNKYVGLNTLGYYGQVGCSYAW
jgi:hypothetical protein